MWHSDFSNLVHRYMLSEPDSYVRHFTRAMSAAGIHKQFIFKACQA